MSWKHALWRAVSAVAGRPARPGLRILGYHSVGTDLPGDPYGLSLSPAVFGGQMDLLASGGLGTPVSLGGAKLDGTPEICVTFDDGFLDALTTAAPVLSGLGLPFTVCVTPGLLDSGRPYLSWDELRQLAKVPGAEIGAHGLTHARLDEAGDDALARELADSRRRLEDALGRPVTVMTWPHGACSRRAADAARAAGFVRAGCSLYGVNEPDRLPLLLKRTEVVAYDGARDFVRKCAGFWDFFAVRQGDPAER
jgi:peptidoglycan/xylan/chitin deacetylase (PgdA/CDA1 family)